MKRKDLIKHLRRHNCELLREGTRHSVWINTLTRDTATVPRHSEIVDQLAKEICKQLNIPIIGKQQKSKDQ